MTIRWGIIGCGNVTEVKSGPAFQKAEGSALVAVMRRNAELAADYATRHNVPRWYSDADKLIHDPDVDAVYVATPPGTHEHYALKVCAAGKPCYVEKPMARSYMECMRMVEAFRAAGLPLFAAYYRRALARFRKVKELVEEGRLGTVTGINCRFASPSHKRTDPANLPWRFHAEESGGGLFLDLGSHTLDILDFIFGPLDESEGNASNLASPYDVEDTVSMTFFTPSGALGTASWNFASAVREDRIEITGTDARLSLSTFGDEPLQLEWDGGAEEFSLPNPPHIQQPLIQTIVDQLRGEGHCPSTGETAARTSAVMDVVLTGYYGRRDNEFWERPECWPGRREIPTPTSASEGYASSS